jgi:NAD(P)-dependent dehydrogenase (short-subunit alcohol dehydrogenase family)
MSDDQRPAHVRELFDLRGRTAIVTGGGRGLGRQLAEALAEGGADVVLCGRKLETCQATAAALAGHGVRTLALACDVRDPAQVEAVVARTLDELGRLDILVNNAGTTWKAWPEELPLAAWQKVIDVNLTGSFLFAQAAGKEMIARGGGKIVNVASVAAFRGESPEAMNSIPYNASKGGIVAFTRDLAVKWARHGINVNALVPGWFPSEMSTLVLERAGSHLLDGIPLGRFGGDDDLKGAVVYLASAASDFVTGQTLVVDGGQLAH